jgi:hypothetical protein
VGLERGEGVWGGAGRGGVFTAHVLLEKHFSGFRFVQLSGGGGKEEEEDVFERRRRRMKRANSKWFNFNRFQICPQLRARVPSLIRVPTVLPIT